MPSVTATQASGTFSIRSGFVDLDLSLVFPGANENVAVEAQDCRTDCATADCRR
jgi:hypothetical protein